MGRTTVAVTIGESGISTGGSLRVQLPNSWHRGIYNAAKGVQSVDSTISNYVSARCARGTATLTCLVEDGSTDAFVVMPRIGIDGRRHRHAWVTRVTVAEGRLEPGDLVEVSYGGGTGSDAGFRSALHPEGREQVLLAIDGSGTSVFTQLDPLLSPWLEVVPDDPIEVTAIAPSVLGPGEEGVLKVAVLDRYANLVTDFEGSARLRVRSGLAEFQATVVFDQGDRGLRRVAFRPAMPGVLRLEVDVSGLAPALTNPIICLDHPPERRLYWGDLHSHSDLSYDAIGNEPFRYARDVAALDFYALSEHSDEWREDTWETIKANVAKYHDDDSFVALLAYEASLGAPWGHHNVYFRGDDGPVVDGYGTLPDLWSMLDATNAITIPHHTGVHWITIEGLTGPRIAPVCDWGYHNPQLRPLIEIYSLHGQCESYDPAHPLAYEQCDFTKAISEPGPHYATDAWMAGLELGVIASSDDHAAQPGRGEGGLAAVWAPRLGRNEIFDGLRGRQTFGTTGSRMIIKLSIDGVDDGAAAGRPDMCDVTAEVHGTDALAYVELVEVDIDGRQCRVLERDEPVGMDHVARWRVSPPSNRTAYYARARQRRNYRDRAVMAWSTPAWIGPRQ